MRDALIEQVLDLHKEGFTLEEITNETGLSSMTIQKWIESNDMSESLAGVSDDEPDDTKDDSMAGLGQITDFIKTREMSKAARTALKKFKTILEGLEEHAFGSAWKKEEIKRMVAECDDVLELVQDSFDSNREEYSKTSVFQIVSLLKDLFKAYLYNFSDPFVISWDDTKMDMIQAGLKVEKIDDQSFDLYDYQLQSAWQVVYLFLSNLVSTSGTLKVPQVDLLISDLKRAVEAISDDLPEELEGEFDGELDVLDNVKTFLVDYRARTDEAMFGKQFIIPEELRAEIVQIMEQPEEAQEQKESEV